MEVRGIGTVGETFASLNGVHWIIPNFYCLLQEHNIRIESHFFRFDDGDWKMSVYPDGCTWVSKGWVVIEVTRQHSCYSLSSTIVRLGIAGELQENVSSRAEFDGHCTFRCHKLIRRSLLEFRKDDLVPGGNLHVFFIKGHIKDDTPHYMFPQVRAKQGYRLINRSATAKECNQQCDICCIEPSTQIEEEIEDDDYEEALTETEEEIRKRCCQKWDKSCIEKSTQTEREMAGKGCSQKCNNDCREPFPQTEEETGNECKNKCDDDYIEASTQTEEEIEMWKLKQDLKDILVSKNISDVVLNVEGVEFSAHRCILAARSPVFYAMMIQETKEKATGVVDIPDVDKKTFSDFLNYLYTGSVEIPENAHQLYTIADKYQLNELKRICFNHMLNSISVDSFCDVLTLSLQHDGEELKEACIHFFAKKSLDIVKTSKWKTFLCENPIIGNELFIKHFEVNK